MPVDVVIATPLERHLVDRIGREVPEAAVHAEPALLPPLRYPCDHRGDPLFRRDAGDEDRWNFSGAPRCFSVSPVTRRMVWPWPYAAAPACGGSKAPRRARARRFVAPG